MNTMKYTILMLILVVFTAGCGSDDDPVAPEPEPDIMAEISWAATQLRVFRDCDSTAARGAGDFHISFTLSDVTSGEEVKLAEHHNFIVKLNDGETASGDDLPIDLRAPVTLKEGNRLLVKMSIYELDPDGPHISVGNGWYYSYSEVSERWEAEHDDGGVDFGNNDYMNLKVKTGGGATCLAYLYGKLSQRLIAE